MFRNIGNINQYLFGEGSFNKLNEVVEMNNLKKPVFFIDNYFKNNKIISNIKKYKIKKIYYCLNKFEPMNIDIDHYVNDIKKNYKYADCIIGIGGGSTLDIAKAVSVMLVNKGNTSNYQGWDLANKKGVFKIGIPTISGTGSESSRTCVLINSKTKIKLGINSNYSLFNQIILDPIFLKTVPKQRYFYTAMDTFFHSFESLKGNFRNPISDAYSEVSLKLCEEVFNSNQNIKTKINREKLMIASYLGGMAIAGSYVGLLHPISAGISSVLKTPHCLTNCYVMEKLQKYYPTEFKKYQNYKKSNNIKISYNVFKKINKDTICEIFDKTIIHERPLENYFGPHFRKKFTLSVMKEIFL